MFVVRFNQFQPLSLDLSMMMATVTNVGVQLYTFRFCFSVIMENLEMKANNLIL